MDNCLTNMMINEQNYSEICRLCLFKGEIMSSIFSSPIADKTISVTEMIMSFTTIKIQTGDGLPAFICDSCLFNVERVFEFKQQCERSDTKLKNSLLSENRKFRAKMDSGVLGEQDVSKMKVESEILIVDPNAKLLDDELSNEIHFMANGFEAKENAKESLPVNGPVHFEQDEEVAEIHCTYCNKLFTNKHMIERHKLIHNKDPIFPCDYCSEVFTDRAALNSHWRQHGGEKSLCLTCGEAFSDETSCSLHMEMHNQIRPFLCLTCGKAFKKRTDLRRHSVVHTGIYQYVCKVCNRAFNRSTNLNKHIRSAHSGSRPFACSICSKSFFTRPDLVRHEIIHTGQKPFECTVCGMAFNRKDKLSRHSRSHTKEHRHKCRICPASFNRTDHLTNHEQIYHPQLLQNLLNGEKQKNTSSNDLAFKSEECNELGIKSEVNIEADELD